MDGAWLGPGMASAATQVSCQKVELTGDVSAGHEWRSTLGQGWVFRVMPIDSAKTPAGRQPWSGWDLVMDREQPAGFPDALLLATPPYDSINEREIGTTFGLRAQDAIGWNPRSFHFLTKPEGLRKGQSLYLELRHNAQPGLAPSAKGVAEKRDAAATQAAAELMDLTRATAAGQFRILDVRLTAGIADAEPFAENWAIQSAKTPHTVQSVAEGKSTPLGMLAWMRFSITLWLPKGWTAPAELHSTPGRCSE